MSRVLITGITGFVGSHLAEYLLTQDVEVWGTYRWRSKTENIDHIRNDIRLVDGDIRDSYSMRHVFKLVKPEYCFHLAAQSFVPESWQSPIETLGTNILGTTNVLEAVRAECLDCRVVVAGSSEEYGKVRDKELPITEKNPLRPMSPYGVSKVATDKLGILYNMSYNLNTVVTRAFNHTGPRRGEVFVVSNFAKQIAQIEKGLVKPVIHVGNLDALRDFTDVRDMVKAYWLAATKGVRGEVYNMCSGKGVKIMEILNMLIGMSKVKITIARDETRMRPSDVPILMGDCGKFRMQTGWHPEIPLEKTVKDTLDYWRERAK